MRYSIDKNTKEPAYLQLYKQFREDITTGVYTYGSKIPSKRLLASETGISIITVEHAYNLLCDEGYVESKSRSGYYVIFNTEDCFEHVSENTTSSIIIPPPMSNSSSELPYSILSKTMRSVITNAGEAILNPSPNYGCRELRESIRQYLARSRGIHANINQIIIGSGSEYLYRLIVDLLGKDKTYGIESPSYKKIQQVYSASNVNIEMLTLGNDGIESSALWSSTADILHITPYRSFPSGVTATASKRHEYMRWASEGERYIVEDDFESEFSISRKAEETLFSHTKKDNIIYMNTFSKTISPSFRVGYMVIPKNLVPVYEDKLGFYSCSVPTYIQFVLAALITNGDFERHINRVRRNKRNESKESLRPNT